MGSIEMRVAVIDLVPVIAVWAGVILLILGLLAALPGPGRFWLRRPVHAAVRLRACRCFADAVARGEIGAAEGHASNAFARAARTGKTEQASRNGERT
jgi:hypothetical protein